MVTAEHTKFRRRASELILDALFDGCTIAVGGFGLVGSPFGLIEAVRDSGVRDLTIIANNMGVEGKGLGLLVDSGQVSRLIASYIGENRQFADAYLAGAVEVEFTPQGTLAERIRAGGAGIAAFYTRTGVGTPVAAGKEHAEFDGDVYILERALHADVALVHAHRADPEGNLVYRKTARNFNPLVATAARTTVAEAEILQDEFIDPDQVHTPGIFVDHVVRAPQRLPSIEQRTVRMWDDEAEVRKAR